MEKFLVWLAECFAPARSDHDATHVYMIGYECWGVISPETRRLWPS
jgi:hypothetical protein